MSIAYRLQDYIAARHLLWEPVPHEPSGSCIEAAHRAHVPPDRVAKAVVLRGKAAGYLMAVIPSNHHLDLDDLGEALEDDFSLVSERSLGELFADCEPGAVPPVGAAYGISTRWDANLGNKADVYFEGGDHRTLVHMNGSDFEALMEKAAARRLPPSCH